MAPDRGASPAEAEREEEQREARISEEETDDALEVQDSIGQEPIGQEPDAAFLAKMSEQPQFTLRALLMGIIIGVLIAFSNTYFGLQTGWISGMAMPSALIGFAYFKGLRAFASHMGGPLQRMGLGQGFSEVENVLVQTVAGSVGTMPLGCGFVGVVPALEFLLKPSETPKSSSTDPEIIAMLQEGEKLGGINLPLGKLVLWALGLCFFGVVFAVPLRKEVIIREKLKFPSGTATALMIGVLHGGEKTGAEGNIEEQSARKRKSMNHVSDDEESRRLLGDESPAIAQQEWQVETASRRDSRSEAGKKDWRKQIRLLTISFTGSGGYVGEPEARHHSLECLRLVDPSLVLYSSVALNTSSGDLHVQRLGLESEPEPSIRRARNYHGSCDYYSHVSWSFTRMGCAITDSQV